MTRLRIGEIYRYSRPYSNLATSRDGLINYFAQTAFRDEPAALLEKGINPIAAVRADGTERRPAILVSSSPHRAGSTQTPWRDVFDTDNGVVRYYGDAKHGTVPPESYPGNAALLTQFDLHSSLDAAVRRSASPLLLFQRVTVGSRIKGNLLFQGLAVIESAERVVQRLPGNPKAFTNFAFEMCVLRMDAEDDEFDWSWINLRRTSASSDECLRLAPRAWKKWVAEGHGALPKLRRSVSHSLIVPPKHQQVSRASAERRALDEIYEYYSHPDRKKARFELLAMRVVSEHLRQSGIAFREGWVTRATGDRGTDFVGRVDLGREFGATRLVVLGQAKCELPNSSTGGLDVARTVARLRRGWIGAYVTTGTFSIPVQHEVIEDQYPLLLINGGTVARTVLRLSDTAGISVSAMISSIDAEYHQCVSGRRPGEILRD